MKISLSEQLENLQEARYSLYLEVGNMQDILNMTIKDFYGVMEAAKARSERMSGKPTVKKLKQSQKDMIAKAKERNK